MHVYLRGLCKIREEGFGCGGIPSVFHGVGRDSYSHDDIVSYGLDSMALTLYADGTASLGFGEETEQFQWKEGMLYSDDEEIAFTVENGMLTVSMDTESMVFERVKDAPEKMEVQNPEETTGTPTDDTEVSGTDLPQQ